ncbi:MAG: hypothetical protein HQL87_02820 [Magnetococcales bacterium]|nr:hypothetical protein [Magnetococcales bacterium]
MPKNQLIALIITAFFCLLLGYIPIAAGIPHEITNSQTFRIVWFILGCLLSYFMFTYLLKRFK